MTDGRGRFSLTDLEPGLVQVQFTHLSYAPRMTTLIVHPGRTVEINASMSAQPIELEAIEVTVRSSPELCVKVRGSSSMLRLGCLGDLLGLEE